MLLAGLTVEEGGGSGKETKIRRYYVRAFAILLSITRRIQASQQGGHLFLPNIAEDLTSK